MPSNAFELPVALLFWSSTMLGDGIKPQVHGLTEVVIKEYRSDRELFNSINFS